MASAWPRVHTFTLELDPTHVIVARNLLAFAGLVNMVDVSTGHCQDLLYKLHHYNGQATLQFRAVFMDQKGSRFEKDLLTLENKTLLLPGAIVVADNVLKPGAPLFLWRLLRTAAYDTRIVRVNEFAMPSEDWMSISLRRCPLELRHAPPAELIQLDWESDRMRAKTKPGGE